MKIQQEELSRTNDELQDKALLLVKQKNEVENKNKEVINDIENEKGDVEGNINEVKNENGKNNGTMRNSVSSGYRWILLVLSCFKLVLL